MPARRQPRLYLPAIIASFQIEVSGLDQEMDSNWPYNWSPGFISGVFAPFFEPYPLERVSGPSLAGKWPKTKLDLFLGVPCFDCY